MSLLCVKLVDIRKGVMSNGQIEGETRHVAKQIVALARLSLFETFNRKARNCQLTDWWI